MQMRICLNEVVPIAAMPGFEMTLRSRPTATSRLCIRAEGDKCGIYTVMVDGDKPLRLTNGRGDAFPTWSPDGRRVAFYRFSEHGTAIYTVPALGGMEQRLHTGATALGVWPGLVADGQGSGFSESQEDKTRTWMRCFPLADSALTRSLHRQTKV